MCLWSFLEDKYCLWFTHNSYLEDFMIHKNNSKRWQPFGRSLFAVIRTLNYSMKLASPHNLKHISPSKNALGNSRVIYELRHECLNSLSTMSFSKTSEKCRILIQIDGPAKSRTSVFLALRESRFSISGDWLYPQRSMREPENKRCLSQSKNCRGTFVGAVLRVEDWLHEVSSL